jgi:3-phosphoshikimate 1-carboxyvinyltransferase
MQMTSLQSNPGSALKGVISIPGDKSITHRALILGALANLSHITLHNWLQSLDCLATMQALDQMGVEFVHLSSTKLQINCVGLYGLEKPQQILNAGNSGTTMRLLTGVLAAQKFSSTITGDASLCRRPMRRIIDPLTMMGAKITAVDNDFAPLCITGGAKLQPINYAMPVASAQIKSAILLASLYVQGQSQITAPGVCRDHTEQMLQNIGAEMDIPGDISSAAFFIVGATITPGSDIYLQNIGINPTRSAVLQILHSMGADIEIHNCRILHGEMRADLRVRYVKKLRAITIPQNLIANAIDELPILCLAAACADGTTIIRGAGELRHKESDRIAMIAQGLNTLGITTSVFSDGLNIRGGVISGGVVDSAGDHRIAMTFLFAGLVAQNPVIVQDTHNIATSFPDFVQVARAAGMIIREINLCQI